MRGTVIVIRETIKHFELEEYSELLIQATSVCVENGNNDLTVTAICYPIQGGADETRFTSFSQTLGDRFISSGDYNAKHSHWDSKLITSKGRALLKVANSINADIISIRKPTDSRKIPDLLDFFVIKDISFNYVKAEELVELKSDHNPVLLSLSSNVVMQKRKHFLTNKHTD
ncbi:Endonuclease/exonuclease/phosphatase [Cinara cedri]|uniref:Endonuclease/exonuclease/phosphatase n=1 Tax=Cinara cedri TaxID=506608 RepID=A0A5E4MYE4_9HEMI|nr:Endonuclease/exonuclease/phosphatase [Cinara cedri]